MNVINYLSENFNIKLNEQQVEGILSETQNTLILSVPGSGKTTTLVTRVAYLVNEKGISPENILILTFNRETKLDMETRYKKLFGKLNNQTPLFATIHSFAYQILIKYANLYSRQIPKLISENKNQKNTVLREIYKNYSNEYLADEKLELLDTLISRTKNLMSDEEEIVNCNKELDYFSNTFYDYENYKKVNNLIDYDDMLILALDILNKLPKILNFYKEKYKYVNVDEAQDTSLLQHKIIKKISESSSLFMVGDEDQSIYSFRGATPKELLKFNSQYKNSVVIKMEENFRSNKDIVDRANIFIKQNKNRYDKNMFTKNTDKNSIEIIKLPDWNDQYKIITDIILNDKTADTIGILYQNNETVIPLVKSFYKNDIKFSMRDYVPTFFNSNVIRDLKAYYDFADDFNNIKAFERIYFKLGMSKLIYDYVKDNLHSHDDIFSCILSLKTITDNRRYVINNYKHSFKKLRKLPVKQGVDYILNELNLENYLKKRSAETYISIIQSYQIIKATADDKSDYSDLERIFDVLKQNLIARKNIEKNQKVLLSTFHSAKGMEFDNVYILDLKDGLIPNQKYENNIKDYENEYEENVRLFYVAVTRAKKSLTFLTSNKENKIVHSPSKFINNFVYEKNKMLNDNMPVNNIVGKEIIHKKFGEGRVISQDGKYIETAFLVDGKKKLDLKQCLDNDIIIIK